MADSALHTTDHMKCNSTEAHSNGITEEIGSSKASVTNGFTKEDKSIQNGGEIDEHFVRRKRKEIKMTTMEKDIISLIGQHLREKGFR